MHFVVNLLLRFQVTEALTLVIKLAEYLAKLPKVRMLRTISSRWETSLYHHQHFMVLLRIFLSVSNYWNLILT